MKLSKILARSGVAAAVIITASAIMPAESALAAGPTCPATSGGVGKTYYSVTCTKGPGTVYVAVVTCTNGKTSIGQEARYSSVTWSEADCASGYKVKTAQVGTA